MDEGSYEGDFGMKKSVEVWNTMAWIWTLDTLMRVVNNDSCNQVC